MILVNGAATDSVAVLDRGLAYGDGVFRTLPVRGGSPQCWPLHFRKLEQDCAALGILCPEQEVLAGELRLLGRDSPDFAAKIIVTRGSGDRGYAPPQSPSPTRIVMSAALPEHSAFDRAGIQAHLCATRLSFQPRLAGIKHLNRLENVLARAEWSDPAVAEGLMLDAEDRVVCGTMSNLFIVEGAALITPELSRCGVAGVTRERIMRAAEKHGVACREEPVLRARFLAAQEALVVNSLIGAWQIRACAGRRWEPGKMTFRVREWLDEEVG